MSFLVRAISGSKAWAVSPAVSFSWQRTVRAQVIYFISPRLRGPAGPLTLELSGNKDWGDCSFPGGLVQQGDTLIQWPQRGQSWGKLRPSLELTVTDTGDVWRGLERTLRSRGQLAWLWTSQPCSECPQRAGMSIVRKAVSPTLHVGKY